ncbi:hypothetical protein GGR52DRAFT_587168 [Hypoxylon sp. FL1284]|nr:hypothetical protein GGR52DRAFT_587168 [Hypoxylon sp. FL1284]
MASVTPGSVASSSPIPSQHHRLLTPDLQPPPLRLPRRSAAADLDGPASLPRTPSPKATDDPFSSTIDPERSVSPSQPAAAQVLPRHHRATGPKLDSLVSKFEILDAVNSAEGGPSSRPRPSALPRVQGAQVTSTLQIGKSDTARTSSDPSPAKAVSLPSPSRRKSMLPVSTSHKVRIEDGNADSDKHRAENVGETSGEGSGQPSAIQIPSVRKLEDNPNHDPTYASRADRRPGWPLNLNSGPRNALAKAQSSARRERTPEKIHRIPKLGHKSGPAIGCTSKVADLRRLFERSAASATPPNSIKSFWRGRGRPKPASGTERDLAAECGVSGSSAIWDEDVTTFKRIPVPELTTVISTDDFTCDFTETLDGSRRTTPGLHLEEAAENSALEQNESPVRSHIQHFEQLEHDSIAGSVALYPRAQSYDASSRPSLKEKENAVTQVKAQASRHPLRQRSVQLWRRISNPFSRLAADVRDDSSNDGQRVSSNTYVGTSSTRQSSVRRRPKYNGSGLFRYHRHRTSELVRSSVEWSQSDARLSINDELMARFENRQPRLTYTSSTSSRLSMRRTFPFLARMSDGLGCAEEFDSFGLDGALVSRASRRRDKPAAGEGSQNNRRKQSTSAVHDDASAESEAVPKQPIAERKLRRAEEKQLRKEQRAKKRAKARGVDQEEESGKDYPGEGSRGEDEHQRGTVKGKGKEVAGKEKKERSWSKVTSSGFVVRQINDIKLKHPRPRRPGQVRRLVNMYKGKASSSIKLGKGSGVSSASGSAAPKSESTDKH